jgi:hypothetical protein
MTKPLDTPEDPVLEARIQHALLPYIHRLTPAALAEARRLLTVVLTTHPVAAPLMNRLRERRAPGSSGVVTCEEDAAEDAVPQHQAHGNGKPNKQNKKKKGPR